MKSAKIIEKRIVYFKKLGKENTDNCIDIVVQRLKENDINDIVIASSTGETALKLHEKIRDLGINLICVTNHAAMGLEKKEILNKNKSEMDKRGIKLISSTHTLSAAERSIAERWGGTYPLLLIAETYRTFCEGMKVCIEVSLSATDSGKVPANQKILVVAGTSKGCDTAVVLKSSYSCKILQDLAINEILCMPITEGIKHAPR